MGLFGLPFRVVYLRDFQALEARVRALEPVPPESAPPHAWVLRSEEDTAGKHIGVFVCDHCAPPHIARRELV